MRLALLGQAVAHSLSSRLHEEALRLQGLDGSYTLLRCPDDATVQLQIARLRRGELDGVNVTTPYKHLAATLCDHLVPQRLHRKPWPPLAINTLWLREGQLWGAATDGPGLIDALHLAGVPLVGRKVALLGAGGAAQAVAPDLLEAGVRQLVVAARSPRLAWLVRRVGPQAVRQVAWGNGEPLADCTLVLHATTLGHGGQAVAPATFAWLPWAAWRQRGAVLADLVYAPGQTAWQQAAIAAGLATDARLTQPLPDTPTLGAPRRPRGVLLQSGEAMLAGQAARSWLHWTGNVLDPLPLLRAITSCT